MLLLLLLLMMREAGSAIVVITYQILPSRRLPKAHQGMGINLFAHRCRGAIDIEGWHDPIYRDALEMTGQVHALGYLKRCRGGDFVPNPVA
jgi:hypothetical protein